MNVACENKNLNLNYSPILVKHMGGAIIKLQRVTKTYHNKPVLKDVDFLIKEGEILGIVGGNGAGKTTLLNTLVGFSSFKGDILFRPGDEQFIPLSDKSQHINGLFGFASQDPSFYPNLSVKENLAYFAVLFNMPDEIIHENISIVLELIGMSAEKDTISRKLSYGMQKRLDIGCALMHNPAVLILDEPTAHLDTDSANQIWNLIKEINKSGTTVVITSHFLHELSKVCDRIASINNQKLSLLDN